ncbi:hypothetical protein [Pseudomonas sp. EpS/L25]|uniref:hypothetical protein n=1 Tax=Pseudomonas sp. EpS/L25 TaxID=1749078 RepID=UPI000743ECB9|nr:hypothetical protein [Pseudomonas sp. EpS/L25]KUM34007.1 hypothetical protein AR540_14820 [Pseudomonas sp. EpS/L25]
MSNNANLLGGPWSSLALHLHPSLASRRIQRCLERLADAFTPIPPPRESLWWDDGHPLQLLLGLPRAALSGPTQEIKSTAHALLSQLVVAETLQSSSFDLRALDGLCHRPQEQIPDDVVHLEELAALPAAREQVRIIGYRDFQAALYRTLPTLSAEHPLKLRQANWRGQRFFLDNDAATTLAFASIVAYARIRGIAVEVPVQVQQLRLEAAAIERLHEAFTLYALPNAVWNHPDFIQVLLGLKLDYARLPMAAPGQDLEWLLLPNAVASTRILAETLERLGAAEVISYLRGF